MKKLILSSIFLCFSFCLSAQNRPGHMEMQNYRGQRTLTEEHCSVSGINSKFENNELVIEIRFTGPVDPRFCSSSNILVNGIPSNGARINFNREATVARVHTKGKLPAMVTVQGVKSFNGKSVPAYSKDCR